MGEADNTESNGGEFGVGSVVHIHCHETQFNNRNYSVVKHIGRVVRVLLCEDMDESANQNGNARSAIHSSREYCYSDMCCRIFWHCF